MSPSGIAVPGGDVGGTDHPGSVIEDKIDTIVISMKKLNRILEIDAEKKLVTIEPGANLTGLL